MRRFVTTVGLVVAAAAVVLGAGLLLWWVQHADDPPRVTASHTVHVNGVPTEPVWADSRFEVPSSGALPPAPGFGSAAVPSPLGLVLDGRLGLSVDGRTVTVELRTDLGALCITPSGAEPVCRGGAVRYQCGPDSSCTAPDSVLAASGDLVLTEWSVPTATQFGVLGVRRLRLWRITPSEPVALLDLTGVEAEPDLVALDPATGAVELVADVESGWQLVRCDHTGACRRTSTLSSRPIGRNALRAAPAPDLTPAGAWPAEVSVTLTSCTVMWPPSLDVRGTISGAETVGLPAVAGLVLVDIIRPDTPDPTVVPVDAVIVGDGEFSFVLDAPPMGDIVEPPALRALLDGGRCRLRLTASDGTLWTPGQDVDLR